MSITAELLRDLIRSLEDEGLTVNETYEKLEASHSHLIDEYMSTYRRTLVTQEIRSIRGSRRRNRERAARFAEIRDAIESGQNLLSSQYPVVPGLSIPLAEMTRPQVLKSAHVFEAQGRSLLGKARFMYAVAKKMKDDEIRVGEILSPEAAQKLSLQMDPTGGRE